MRKLPKKEIRKCPKRKLLILILTLFSFSLFLIYFFNGSIFYRAYLSIMTTCGNKDETFLKDKGYQTTAETNFIKINKENITEVNIVFFDPELATIELATIIHELCHVRQKLEGRLYSCNHTILRYLNELECYIKGAL